MIYIKPFELKLLFFLCILLDLDEDENEREQKRCDEKLREIENGFSLLKEMLDYFTNIIYVIHSLTF